jgi:ubiquinone/menaquinone biosynthesis C-methylase UbiE
VNEKEITREAYNYIVHRRKPLEVVKEIGGKIVGDIGCGAGQNCIVLQAKLKICLDFSGRQLREARKRGCEYLVEADMEYLPFRDNVFDSLIYIASLHHLRNPNNAIKEAYRVLRIGGKILVTVWLVKFPFKRNVYITSNINGKEVKRFYHLYLPWELRKNMEKNGFKTLKYSLYRVNSLLPNNALYLGFK